MKKWSVLIFLGLFLLTSSLAGCGGSNTSPNGGTPTPSNSENSPTPTPASGVLDISHDGASGASFGKATDEVKRFQTFIAGAHQSITGIDVKIRKNGPGSYNNVLVELYEIGSDFFPSNLLATTTIDTTSLGQSFTVLNASLTYHSLISGKTYAIVLGQNLAGITNDGYEWCVKSLSADYYFGKYNAVSWVNEYGLGDGWLKVYVDNGSGTNPFVPGQSGTCSVGGVSFNLHYVPGTTNLYGFGTGISLVSDAYWTGETEVTYELWKTVRDWATDPARGTNGYTMNNGSMGYGTGVNNQHPVTFITWRDAIVWCNALCEMTGLAPVYKNNGVVVRNSTQAAVDGVSDPVVSDKGYRLPSTFEWELAARYKDGVTWTPGNYASGASAAYTDVTATQLVAWYQGNSNGSTHPVNGKAGNALGIYDMSGNVFEFCFDQSGSNRVFRGGSWYDAASYAQVALESNLNSTSSGGGVGFRLVRTE